MWGEWRVHKMVKKRDVKWQEKVNNIRKDRGIKGSQ